MGRSHARGFSLLEVVVSIAIVIVLTWLLFHVLSQALLAARMQSADDLEQSTVGRLIDNLTTEEDDAWAIYTPPGDVLGKSNSDGHEVDFFARDGQQRPYFWAYSYDSAAQTVTRYRFGAPGGAPSADTTYTGVTKFYTRTYPVTALQDATTPIYSALYNGASLQSGTVHFYPSMPWIAGGNTITYVHFESATMKQDLQLATQTAPSGFTVVVYYTPSPSPPPTPAPASTPRFKTWPAQLNTVVQGAVTTTGWWTTAVPASSVGMSGAYLNALLGGGVARAAGTSQPCYAQALSDGVADTSLARATIGGITYAVSTDGCEIQSTDGGSTWTAISQPVVIAYEPDGSSATFNIKSNGCSSNGAASIGPWSTNNTAVSAVEPVTGKTAGASCAVAFTDGQSTQTLTPDNGLVDIAVSASFTPVVYHQLSGWSCSNAPCTYAITGWAYQTTDGGRTWMTGYGSWTGRCWSGKYNQKYCQSTPPTGTQWYCNLGSTSWTDMGNTASGGSDAGCGPGDNYLSESYKWPFNTFPPWNDGPP